MTIGNYFRAALASAVVIAAVTSASLANELEDDRILPAVTALVPNFYYHDLEAAREWYVGKLGFQPVSDWGWGVIVEVGPGMQIALVYGARGTLRPVDEKGTMLVIETEELEAWYRSGVEFGQATRRPLCASASRRREKLGLCGRSSALRH
jgi:catechol 2,3-dioxygenase-like lactoylglutathione lyase family enzyme